MRRKTKQVLSVIALALSIMVAVVAWELWMMSGYCSPIYWSTKEGGLQLYHVPGKHITAWFVDDSYVSGTAIDKSLRQWSKTYAGATERWIGAVQVPSPEELFNEAHFRAQWSEPIGLCEVYNDVSESLKAGICDRLRDLCRVDSSVREMLKSRFGKGNDPWIAGCLCD